MRILALDWGQTRVGAAISDPDGRIAFPLDKFIDSKNAETEVKKIVSELHVEKIIIGWPKTLSGQEGASASRVHEFEQNLSQVVASEIELVDERFTSVEAGKRLTSEGLNEKQQRSIKDNIAAQIMLQSYLDTNVKK